MEFALTEEQQMLQQTTGSILADLSPLDAVRKYAEGDSSASSEIDNGLLELGISGLTIPETYGGPGLGIMEAALVQECLGNAVSPGVILGSTLAAIAIEAAGSDVQKSEYLPKIASGKIHFGVAFNEYIGARDNTRLNFDGSMVNGTTIFALEAEQASHLLLSDAEGRLHVIHADAAGLTISKMKTIDRTRCYSEVVLDNVVLDPLSAETQGEKTIDKTVAAGRVMLAADTLGAAQYMIDAAVGYAKEREQFGRVIGSFQAVKHMCAEMAAKLEPSRALVWHAAYALQSDDDEGVLLACLAKSHLAEVGTFIARTATEVHGGMGFTDLLGLHFWFKRIGANRQLLGGPEKVRNEAAHLQGLIDA